MPTSLRHRSFIQNEYGLSQFHFSLIFALNAVAIGAGALLAVRFSTTAKATYFGTAGSLIASIAGFIFALTTKDLYTYEGCLLLMVFCLGFIFTGAASAIIGSIGFLLGGIVSPIVSLGNIQATSFAVCTVALGLGLLFVAVLHHRNSRPHLRRGLLSPDEANVRACSAFPSLPFDKPLH